MMMFYLILSYLSQCFMCIWW